MVVVVTVMAEAGVKAVTMKTVIIIVDVVITTSITLTNIYINCDDNGEGAGDNILTGEHMVTDWKYQNDLFIQG
jgi:hypothetical protein